MADLLAAALNYAAEGIPVFPCAPLTKVPATAHGFHDATTDADIIADWWRTNPDYNIAFSPHTVGQGIVDLDGQEGIDAWCSWARDMGGVDRTWTVRTPRGGLHLYFVGELPTSVRKLIPHQPVDTRGRGSYALLPPSVTLDGSYRTLYEGAVPVALPVFLADRVRAMAVRHTAAGSVELDTPTALSRAGTYLAGRDPAIEGQGGNQWTYETFCDLRTIGLSEDAAFSLADMVWNDRCQPPWDEYELRQIAENAYRYATDPEPGSKAVDPASGLLDRVAAPPPEAPAFKLRHPGELVGLTRSPSLVEGILPAQGTGVLYAPPGSFKSFIALGLGFAVATGRAAFGVHKVSRTAPVVYCAGEGHLAVATQRLPALFAEAGLTMTAATPFYLLNGVPLARVEDTAARLLASIKAQISEPPALIIVDTMARSLAGLKENDASEAGLLITLLETLASELGCFVLAVGHEGKDGSKGVRGSSAVEAGVDVIWQARRPSETSPGVSLHCRKDKDGDNHEAIYLLGTKLGSSMVFASAPEAEWQKACGGSSGITSGDVGKALVELGAVEGKTISTKVLASQMVGSDEAKIAARIRALSRGFAEGKRLLAPYGGKEEGSKDILWTMPNAKSE